MRVSNTQRQHFHLIVDVVNVDVLNSFWMFVTIVTPQPCSVKRIKQVGISVVSIFQLKTKFDLLENTCLQTSLLANELDLVWSRMEQVFLWGLLTKFPALECYG